MATKEPMHKRLYKDSPSMARDTESGKMNVAKGVSKGEREESEVSSGVAGLPIHVQHAHERREMKHRHIHEHHSLHHKHQMEHSHHDHGEHGHKEHLHEKHEREHKEMHERHEHEHKKMHERHEKEHGGMHSRSPNKREEKPRAESGKEHIKSKE